MRKKSPLMGIATALTRVSERLGPGRPVRLLLVLQVILIGACGSPEGKANETRKQASGNPGPQYEFVPEAARACGLPPQAVIHDRTVGVRNNIRILPEYQNSRPETVEAIRCLGRWAASHGRVHLPNQFRLDD